jgi:cytidylate kinase
MSARTRPVVAIDGPAGAGKSTVTRRVAERLGYVRVDTGALYRTVALAADRAGVSFDDAERLTGLANDLVQRTAVQLERTSDGLERVLLDQQDVSNFIRSQRIGDGASRVSAVPGVRGALLELQRSAGRAGGVVLEGRDIGTVVFPDAEAKFYLTASVEVRAQRRYEELLTRGEKPNLETVKAEVIERDARDSSRSVAPLRQAEDAVVVDSSNLDIEGVAERIVKRVREVELRLSSRAR